MFLHGYRHIMRLSVPTHQELMSPDDRPSTGLTSPDDRPSTGLMSPDDRPSTGLMSPDDNA